jgi:hypothetical protein
VALHATDPATVYLSAAARLRQPTIAQIERALYDDRTLVRMLGMRRTMFVVPRDLAGIVQSACTRAIAEQQRKLSHQLFGDAGLADDVPTWLAKLEDATVAALQRRGEATAQELGQDVPDLKRQILMAAGKDYSAMQGISTRVLLLLAADGRIVRGRPRGSWISSQYRWAPIDTWLPGGLMECAKPLAQADLIRRWLVAFGPGTLTDLKWWSGLTMGEVKRAVGQIDVREVEVDDGPALVLADDIDTADADAVRGVAFLPALDPTPMGYAQRDWFLGPHASKLFDRSGNIGPTIWSAGRIVGGWAQRKDGTIACRLLEDIGAAAEREVEDAAHALGDWLGEARVTPRFRTPLERELST